MNPPPRYPPQTQNLQGAPSTSLRPRNKRRVSGLDDAPPDFRSDSYISYTSTPIESPFHSRPTSPLPSKHPSRSPSLSRTPRTQPYRVSPSRRTDQLGNDLASSLSGLWGKSWTSLQGLASNVLGNDALGEPIKDKSPQRMRRPLEATHSQWGPHSRDHSQPGAGSREERKAMVREKKRQEMLMASGSVIAENPQVKRRTSDDNESVSAPPADYDDRDALVYVHQVKPQDTLAGLSIRFNCQLAIVKKSNRMWSNDAIQTRTTIVIPVDACGVKGRLVSSPTDATPAKAPDDSLHTSDTPKSNQTKFSPVCRSDSDSTMRPTTRMNQEEPVLSSHRSDSIPSQSIKPPADEPPWRHDSWVQLDGHTGPVEIARMPRRDLGYFPRARRKSISYSDLDTPAASIDLPRAPSITISEASSNTYGAASHRKRGSSGASNTHAWALKMSGPGGVGILGGRGVSAPGPSTDKFTKAVSKHLPNVAPPKYALMDDDDEDSSQVAGASGLDNFLGATEGWVRKIAQTAAKVVEHPPPAPALGRSGRGTGSVGTSGTGGDLIELSNAFEIGDEDLVEEDRLDEQRGRARLSEARDRNLRGMSRHDLSNGSKKKGD